MEEKGKEELDIKKVRERARERKGERERRDGGKKEGRKGKESKVSGDQS